ncbi:MAG: hypothetical protein N2663_00855 [Chlorobi bacterium]|nr:hypothetical protein [Chlorobiota bacterium]
MLHVSQTPGRVPVSTQQPAVDPITYYEQLAEAGALYDFLQTNMLDRFSSDIEFRKQMLGILLDRSPIVLPEVECELLWDLHNAFNEFFIVVQQCNNSPSVPP